MPPLTFYPDVYEGEFTNAEGTYNVFCFHYSTTQGILSRQYSNGSTSHYDVRKGIPIGVTLSSYEQLWLRLCWNTAQRSFQAIQGQGEQKPSPSPRALPYWEDERAILGVRARAERHTKKLFKTSSPTF